MHPKNKIQRSKEEEEEGSNPGEAANGTTGFELKLQKKSSRKLIIWSLLGLAHSSSVTTHSQKGAASPPRSIKKDHNFTPQKTMCCRTTTQSTATSHDECGEVGGAMEKRKGSESKE